MFVCDFLTDHSFFSPLGNEAINILAPPKTEKPTEQSGSLPAVESVDEQQRKEQLTELVEESSQAEQHMLPNADDEPDVSVVASDSPSTTPAAGTDSPSTVAAAAAAGTDSPSTAATVAATGTDSPTSQPGPATYGKKPKPYYPGSVHAAVNLGPGMPNIPFFMEFFQPFQPYGHQPGPVYQKQPPPPFRNQPPQPFGVSVDPFNPFASGPAQSSPFHQLVEAYTNEFRSTCSLYAYLFHLLPYLDRRVCFRQNNDIPSKSRLRKSPHAEIGSRLVPVPHMLVVASKIIISKRFASRQKIGVPKRPIRVQQ